MAGDFKLALKIFPVLTILVGLGIAKQAGGNDRPQYSVFPVRLAEFGEEFNICATALRFSTQIRM